jgi:hypothetical protein
MTIPFTNKPTTSQIHAFGLRWMQALEAKDYDLAMSMLVQREHKLTAKKLQSLIERALKSNDALAVKLPARKAFCKTIELDWFDETVKKSKKKL